MVRVQARLADHLGVARWHAVIGGSMGGMQVLEWAIMYPQRVRSIIPIATCMQATAQQIAWGAIGRRAIELDPRWRGGDYYDAEPGDGPDEGLAVARMVAQVTFRSDNVFTERFGRDLVDDQFEVERYLDYHGAKLGRRFDTGSYVVDRHGDGPPRRRPQPRQRGRRDGPHPGVGADDRHLVGPAVPELPAAPDRRAAALGGRRQPYVEVDSPHGHDAFLINLDQLADPISRFLG